MTYVYYINGEERMPTPEEAQILMDRMMEKLGYERVSEDEDQSSNKKDMAVV